MKFRQTHGPAVAAAKASISRATAFRFERDGEVPSRQAPPRGRRRPDPLSAFFDAEVVPMLTAAPGLRAIGIFAEMQRRHPDLPKVPAAPWNVASAPGAPCMVPSRR